MLRAFSLDIKAVKLITLKKNATVSLRGGFQSISLYLYFPPTQARTHRHTDTLISRLELFSTSRIYI